MRNKLLAILVLLSPGIVSDVTGPVSWGQVSETRWQGLLQAGWEGDPQDGREALYPPS